MPASEASAQEQAPAAQLAQIEFEDLKIDRAGEIPIGVQLAWGLRARIGDGRLAPGQRLPGLRELAEMLGINANTARTVYQRLEQEGLIDSRQGTGTFVARVAQEPSAVGQIAADAARQALRTGVDPREVAAALYVTPERGANTAQSAVLPEGHTLANSETTNPPFLRTNSSGHMHAGKQASERRRELRAQIAALEQALSEIQANHPGLIPAPNRPARHAGPRLLGVEELETVRMELVHRIAAAEPLLQASSTETPRAAKAVKQSANDTVPAVAAPEQEKLAPSRAPRARPRTRPSTA
jgi:DNA-binding transcriptional regulator YhcF (GntR family)